MKQLIFERWREFTREQKISVCVLVVCGILALLLSLSRLQRTIREPFLTDKAKAIAAKGLLGTTAEEEEARLRRIDTDGDSLSDWDEVNVYRLNPNLRDTCGDRIPDNIRVATGKNLSCALGGGNALGELNLSGVQSASSAVGILGDVQSIQTGAVTDFLTSSRAATGSPAALGASQFLARDPAVIRAALKGRVEQAKLDALSDQKLLELYDLALVEQKKSLEAGSFAPRVSPTP